MIKSFVAENFARHSYDEAAKKTRSMNAWMTLSDSVSEAMLVGGAYGLVALMLWLANYLAIGVGPTARVLFFFANFSKLIVFV